MKYISRSLCPLLSAHKLPQNTHRETESDRAMFYVLLRTTKQINGNLIYNLYFFPFREANLTIQDEGIHGGRVLRSWPDQDPSVADCCGQFHQTLIHETRLGGRGEDGEAANNTTRRR